MNKSMEHIAVNASPEHRSPSDYAPISLLQIVVHGQVLALPVHSIDEILPMATLSAAPKAPTFLAGFLNVGGKLLPILQFAQLIGANESFIGRDARLILMHGPSMPFGVIACEVQQIIKASMQSVTTVSGHPLFKTALCRAGEVIPIVQVEGLLLEEERKRIVELTEARQRRLLDLEEVTA